MPRIKLSEYCKQNNISYITAYRWFKADKLPVPAIQTESGTILVDVPESSADQDISLFVQKTIEFSNKNASIGDFAAYILNNFSLKVNSGSNQINTPSIYNLTITSSTSTTANSSTLSTPNSTYFSSTPISFSCNLSEIASVPENIFISASANISDLPLDETKITSYNKEPINPEDPQIFKNKKTKKESK